MKDSLKDFPIFVFCSNSMYNKSGSEPWLIQAVGFLRGVKTPLFYYNFTIPY